MAEVEGEDVMLQASMDMDQIFRDYGIEHSFEIYDGDHSNRIPERMETKMIPFFSKTCCFRKNSNSSGKALRYLTCRSATESINAEKMCNPNQ